MRRRIFAIATDSAGCYLYRLHWPLTHLNPDEFEIVWHGPSGEGKPGDVVVGQRIAGHNQAWLDLCADPSILAVYEVDDDIIDVDPANIIPYSIFAPQREGTIANIAAADVVTCSTPTLAAKIASRWNPWSVVLPNCLPRQWFDAPDKRRHDGTITIGWAGSMFHQQDWVGIGEQLAKVVATNPQQPRIRWHTIGADYMSPHVQVSRSTPWSTMDHYLAALDFDIGLAPLARTNFNQSKSWAKLLEYGARGIPAVATAWGQYVHWPGEGVIPWSWTVDAGNLPVMLIGDPEEFAPAIEHLCNDDVRVSMGAAARQRAEQFEIGRQVHRWADVYRRHPEEVT